MGNHNSAAQEIFKDIPPNVASNVNVKVPTKIASGTSVTEGTNEDVQNSVKYNEVAENFPAVEGNLIITPTPRIPPRVITSSTLEKIIDGSRHIETPNVELTKHIVENDSDSYIIENIPNLTNTDLVIDNKKSENSPKDNILENNVKQVLQNISSEKDTKEKDSDKTLFDDIDVKTSELSFTKDKLINKASFSETDAEPIKIPPPSPIDAVEETDNHQTNEANFNDFKLDEFKFENDINDIFNETTEITTTTAKPRSEAIVNKKQSYNVADLNKNKAFSIIASDNELDTSNYEEKELYPTSTPFKENAPAETLVETDQQILATPQFIESSFVFSEASSKYPELSSSFTNPTTSPLHLQKSSYLVLDEPSSLLLKNLVISDSPIPLTSPSGTSLVTETIFGFLNFVTTVRNTVMVFTQAEAGDSKLTGQTESIEIMKPTELSAKLDFPESFTVSSFIQTQASLPQPNVITTIQPTAVTQTTDVDYSTGIREDVVNIKHDQEEDYVVDLEHSDEEFDGSEIIEQPKKRFDNFVRKGKKEKENESLEEERQSAELSFKERLKQRFKQFRKEHKGVLEKKVSVNSQPINDFGRSFKTSDEKVERDRDKPKFKSRTEQIRKKLAEVLKHSQRTIEKSTLERTFVPSFLRTKTLSDTSRIQPSVARSLFDIGPSSRTPAKFQRRNLLDRVLGKSADDEVKDDDKEVKHLDTEGSPEVENDTLIVPAKSIQPSNSNTNTVLNDQVPVAPLFNASPFEIDTNTNLQSSMHENIDTEEELFPTPLIQIVKPDIEILTSVPQEDVLSSPKQTNNESTLTVATVVPKDQIETYLEIATIRSPYTFDIENDQQSTRYITVTRTFTSDILLTPRISHIPEERPVDETVSLSPQELDHVESTLHISTVFPENIESSYIEVATIRSPYSFIAEDDLESTRFITVTRTFTSDFANIESTSIETASAFNFLNFNLENPLETVTETLTSEEVIVKTSVVPVVVDEDFTSLQTLTQSFTVTSLVTAVKTLAASRPSNFAPSASFIDIDREFDNQESINRETFLPIELGFANKNQIKNKESQSEKEKYESIERFPFQDLVPSFVLNPSQTEIIQANSISVLPTPSFPTPPLTPPSASTVAPPILQNLLSSEQLQYIKLLQERLSGIKPQVVTLSEEVLRTETEYATNTIKIIQGDTEFETTLLKPIGLTTITDYKYLTTTLPPQLSSLPPVPTNLPPINPLTLGLAPSFTTIISPVTHSTVVTETDTQEYKIIFRARPITTTVLSTRVVSTVLTSFVTQTLSVPPIVGGFIG